MRKTYLERSSISKGNEILKSLDKNYLPTRTKRKKKNKEKFEETIINS